MVWTKDEVDKYVVQVERNCKSAHERNLKGFAFARLYREASDNESAKRYLEAYISESEGDFRGHCLMGQLYESTGQLEKAVASYRRSLELNNTQKELVLKVVRLYCSVAVHPDRARAWADRGARLFPGHPDVFQLRLHLLESAEVVDYEALEDLISEELSKRPRDVNLHIRLVRLYSVRGRLDEAFSHCVAVWKTKAFKDSLEWVACCVEMFEKYLSSLEKSIKGEVIGSGNAILDVHSFLLIALCHFLELQLGECNTREVVNVLYRLDHCLFIANSHKIRQTPRRSTSGGPTEWDVILTEMKAQLYMYCGTLLIRLAKEKFVTWPRGLKLACACYLASISICEPETKTPWVARAPKHKDPLKWYIMACSRLSQVGHFLMATRDRHGPQWMDTCHSDCCSRQGLEEILNTAYRNERDLKKSFLARDDEFSVTELVIPDIEQLVSWDEVAVTENPRSLQNITWIGLHWYQFNKEMRPGVGVMVKDIFPELRLDVPNIEKHITPNMLCLRDIEAFVYAVVRTTSARVLEDRDIFYEDYEPQLLPQVLCNSLSLPVQDEWWTAAYNLYTGKFSLNESGKVRRIVQLGIEKIRAVDERHGVHVQLLIYLGKSFGSKAAFLKSSGENPWYYEEHWKSLEKWSLHYLRKALAVLEKLEKDESIPHCEKPLFPHLFETLQEHDVKSELQSVRLAIGGALMKEGKLFDAMEMFEQVKTPPGMYNLAQVYKYLAHVEACAATEETDTESTCPTKEYYQNLHEARDLLRSYLKITKPTDIGREAVIDELTEIERLIQSGFPRRSSASGQRREIRRHRYLESHSSTNASDAQESDDNFWVERPPDPNTKDFIATLSEVALNKGYFQEQMAIRDEAMSIRDETISSMQEEIDMLKDQISVLHSSHYEYSTLADPLYPSPGDTNKPVFESTPVAARQASLPRSAKPLTQPNIKGPLKIDSNFFAGLSSSNSPEKRVDAPEDHETSPTSPGRARHDSSTSYTEDIHFEPLIPLPEQIEVQTGEEEEEVMFSSRAKLYRYDKDVSAWKERGIGTIKILHNSDKGRSRILMRREVVHKICANHFITADMKLEEKKGTANSWIWNTFADYSEEVAKAEQLAVKFKTQDELLLFKEKFEECQKMPKKDGKIQWITADTSEKSSDLMAQFAPKPGSWSCSVCLVLNKEDTTICVACGTAKLSEETTMPVAPPETGFQLPKESTTCSAPQVKLSGLQGNVLSGSPFVFKKSDSGSLSSSPFEKSYHDMTQFAPKPGLWSCSICLVSNEECTDVCVACGAAKLSQEFQLPKESATSSAPQTMFSGLQGNSSSVSPFVFKKSDAGSRSTSPFAFDVSSPTTTAVTSTASPLPFTFGALSLAAGNETSAAPKGVPAASQDFGGSSESPLTSKASTNQPFVLAAFGVPAIDNKSKESTFTFGTSASIGSPLTQKDANTAPAEASVFGGGSPEQGGPSISFGSFGTGSSPCFDLDVPKSESDDQVTLNVSTQTQLSQNQPQSSSAFNTPTRNPEMAEQKLFWQQPTGTFQFGQLETIPPLGGATSWAENFNAWNQTTLPSFEPPTSQQQGAPQTSQLLSHPFTLQGGFPPGSNVDFSSSELLRLLAAAKQQQDSEAEGYDFTPYVVDELSEDTFLNEVTKPLTGAAVKAYDKDDNNEGGNEESEESTEDSLSYTSTEPEYDEEEIETSMTYAPKPTIQASPSQAKVITTPVKPVPIHSTQVENVGPVHLPTHITGRRFLTAKSPLKGTKKQDDDCVLVYEVRASMSDRDKANRHFLPPNFFNFTKHEACPGCIGCRGILKKAANLSKQEDKENNPIIAMPATTEDVSKPVTGTSASHVFGQSATNIGQLTFSSFKAQEDNTFSETQKKVIHKPFQGAGQQLFAEPTEGTEVQDDDNLHFEPVIPLPDEIQVVTGEEGLEVLFSERSKLYRFDVDLGQWKERGVGEVKLLRHPTSGQGRVLMRREQIKKLCANHNITAGMELKPNVGSDRSWVWYTSADYAEGEARPEKLAIKLKTPESAEKFKQAFDDLKEPSFSEPLPEVANSEEQKETGCKLYEHFISTFAVVPDAWSCDVCYVENKAEDSTCVACNSVKPSGDVTEPSIVELVEPNTFQDLNEEEAPAALPFQLPEGTVLPSSQLFTIGRGQSSEDRDTADDEIELSPSKTSSPIKQGITPPQKPSTPPSQSTLLAGLPFGTGTPSKFTFSLVVSPGSPPRKPKSPLSPTSPLSPESPVHGDDDGPHFEPLIPLPEKVECHTGEEGQEVLFCERCKLFRYDGDTSQWKERGVGDIKLLCNPSSGRYRALMRREHVFKLCANHVISADMELKPFPNSDRAWLWTTLADFSEEVPAPETLAARFRTNEVASQFKETFDIALQTIASKSDNVESSANPEDNQPDLEPEQETEQKVEEDIRLVFEKLVTEDQKERAKRLELPSNFFGYEELSAETSPDQSGLTASEQEQPTLNDAPEETTTPSKPSFLFGSPSVASLSFQNVAALSLGDSPFGKKTPDKSPGFKGAGTQLFGACKTDDNNDNDDAAEGDHHDGPHFEPIIPLPDKIDVKTGEEDAEVMFLHRAKLYRFVAEEKQWKERGVGDIKLLRNTKTGKMRVLMRREQVLKLCANHQITTDMTLQPNAGSEKSWVWSTPADFSEQEYKPERLAVRFKNEDIAKQFKEKFEECQEILKNHSSLEQPVQEKATYEEAVKGDLLAKFKAEEGSWECDICMVRNNSDVVECVACASPKPGVQVSQDKQTTGKPLFSFGSGATSSASGFTFGTAVPSPGTGFLFGTGAKPSGTGFSFGSAGIGESGTKPSFTFGSLNQTPNSSSGAAITFGSLKEVGNVTAEQTENDKKDVSRSDGETPGDELEQLQNEEENGGATDDAEAAESTKEETAPVTESETSRSDGEAPGDELKQPQNEEENGGDTDDAQAAESMKEETAPATESETSRSGGETPSDEVEQPQKEEENGGATDDAQDAESKKEEIAPATESETSRSDGEAPGDEVEQPQNEEEIGGATDDAQAAESTKEETALATESETSRSDGEAPGDEVKQPQNEEENGGATGDAQAAESTKEETAPATESETCPPDKQDGKDAGSSKEENFLFGSSSIYSLSFQSVAASSMINSPFGQKAINTSPGFAGAGSTFISQSPGDENHENEHAGDHDGPHFEPIIPLPDKIDVKTGEEDEEVMFSHRSKLYRFVAEEKQWKERGVGDIKLLRNAKTGKMRVLMRREQVLKICANHQITADMTLQPNAGSEKSWVWSTPADFSEQEYKAERLAVRFKNEDIAKQFKEKFEECQELLKNQASLELPVQEEKAHEEEVKEDLLAKFKAEEGSWECDICMVRNSSDEVECAACRSQKPGSEPTQVPTNTGKPLFPFGSGASSSGSLVSFGFTGSSSGTVFSFGSAGASEDGGKPVFSFGSGAPFIFGALPQERNTTGAQDEEGNKGVSHSGEQTSTNEGDKSREDHPQTVNEGEVSVDDGQDKEAAPVKPIQDGDKEGHEEGLRKVLLEKWKPEEGSWECGICMVINNSDKVECAACANPKPGVEVSRDKKTEGKPLFEFGSGATSSGRGFTFGSSSSSSGPEVSIGSGATSFGTGVSFGITGPSDGAETPFSSFGSQKQMPNSSSGTTICPVGSLNQTASSPFTDSKEHVESESETVSVDSEEKPVSALQGGESKPQNVQHDEGAKTADAVGKQQTEEGGPKPDEISHEVNPEERAALSSEKQHTEYVPGESGPDESESKVKEHLQHDADSQPDSSTIEPQEGVSGSSDTQTEEACKPQEEA